MGCGAWYCVACSGAFGATRVGWPVMTRVSFATGMTVVSVFFCVFMNGLEILVACLQAYIFTILSANFIGMAKEE